MQFRLTTFALVGVFVYAQLAQAAMSSTNYEIRWDTISSGGSDTSSSASYILRDTASVSSGSTGSSTTYQLTDGYRAGIFDQIISFDLYIQNSTNERQITGLSGTTVTMSSTTGLSSGDYVVIVQDRGESQVTAFARVQTVASESIVIDRLTVGSSSPSIDGSNDYLYLMTGSSLALEDVTGSSVGTGVVTFQVTIDNDSGYVIQMLEDGNLRESATEVIDDVTDGSVTAGVEEYGARSNDTTLSNSTFDSQDTAISSTAQEIVSRSTVAFNDRSFITFKIGAGTTTSPLNYSHTLTFIASGNF